MKKYRPIYSFCVIGELEKGKRVYFLDRELPNCGAINDCRVDKLFTILKEAEAETTRFDFWIEEEIEETKEKEIEE